jgi:hypothetical protein
VEPNLRVVCPESTIHSANERNASGKNSVSAESSRGNRVVESVPNSRLICESTIESANRRGFIRKAGIVTAAVGIGGILSKTSVLLPKSEADSKTLCCCMPISGIAHEPCRYAARAYQYSCTGPYSNGVIAENHSKCGAAAIWGIAFATTGGAQGVLGQSCATCGVGVYGEAFNSGATGVRGCGPVGVLGIGYNLALNNVGLKGKALSPCGIAILAESQGLTGKFKNTVCTISGGQIDSSAIIQIENGTACCPGSRSAPTMWNIGVAGTCNICSIECGNFFIGQKGKPRLVVCRVCGYVRGQFTGLSRCALSVPLVARGAKCQTGDLQQWQNSGATPLTVINKCGHLGIGTSNPCTPLSVVASSSPSSQFMNNATSGDRTASFRFLTGDGQEWGTGVAGACNVHGIPDGDFYWYNYGSNAARAVISPSGNVGIGTVTPNSTLCVKGTISAVSCATTIFGASDHGTGVLGQSYNGSAGIGVWGLATCGTGGTGVFGEGSEVGIQGTASGPKAIPIVARGAPKQKANLQQWEKACTKSPLSVVNSKGYFGIGTANPTTALDVVGCATISGALKVGTFALGSLSISIKTVTTCYPMAPSDFAILANMSSSCLAVTLPSANQAGRMLYIKNISQSNNVDIKVAGCDEIEAAGNFYKKCNPLTLVPQVYEDLVLVANGTSPGIWYNFGGSFSG